jgi:AcrR family transcriptional regulator
MGRYPAAETAEKHERILSEASRLFRERGLSGVSVGDLMKAADLTHGSFYNHFDSKQSSIAECIAMSARISRTGSKLEWSDRNRYFAIRGLLDGELDFLRGLGIASGDRQGAATFQRSLIRTR